MTVADVAYVLAVLVVALAWFGAQLVAGRRHRELIDAVLYVGDVIRYGPHPTTPTLYDDENGPEAQTSGP